MDSFVQTADRCVVIVRFLVVKEVAMFHLFRERWLIIGLACLGAFLISPMLGSTAHAQLNDLERQLTCGTVREG